MNEMTREAYWAEVRSCAESILSETREYFDGGDWQDALQRRLHETIDGHEWIIYTHRNREVLVHASNPDAYAEEFGGTPATGPGDDAVNWAVLAYAALYADVRDHLSDLDAWDEPEVAA